MFYSPLPPEKFFLRRNFFQDSFFSEGWEEVVGGGCQRRLSEEKLFFRNLFSGFIFFPRWSPGGGCRREVVRRYFSKPFSGFISEGGLREEVVGEGCPKSTMFIM